MNAENQQSQGNFVFFNLIEKDLQEMILNVINVEKEVIYKEIAEKEIGNTLFNQ